MLLSRLLLLLPETAPSVLWVWYVLAAGVGALFCVAGSRMSKMILILTAVAVGATCARYVSAAFGYHPDPMAATIGGAVIAALLMVFLHRFVTALGLSLLLSLWAAAAVWIHAAAPTTWSWPSPVQGGPGFVALCSNQLPPEVAQWMAALAGLAFLAGLAIAALMPRVALPFFWALLGTTIMAFVGLAYGAYVQPHFFDPLPKDALKQTGLLAGTVLVGFLIQWWPRSRPASQQQPAPQAEPAFA